MTDQELLQAFSTLLDEKLEEKLEEKLDKKLEEKLTPIRNELAELKTDVANLKADMAEVKADIAELKTDVANLKADMAEVKTDVEELKEKVSNTNMIVENELRKNIQIIAEGHLDLSRNLHDAVKPGNEIELLSIRISVLETDMQKLKQRIS